MRKRFHNPTLPPPRRRSQHHGGGFGSTNDCPVPCCNRRTSGGHLFCRVHEPLLGEADTAAIETPRQAKADARHESRSKDPKRTEPSGPTPAMIRAQVRFDRLVQQVACRLSDAEWQERELQA